ncbi:tyrosine-type recombinase/integrase [Streptomyces chrestomyceticus]|uniref:tyrosine-type recombinase/integrase n=1 Tax=Streptomyces chrestomyceticus TaxID=68185 RepID=UPI000F61D97D|nr:tyrosine-type recombinase/integrase [Streptomyces chrestomyceticus]
MANIKTYTRQPGASTYTGSSGASAEAVLKRGARGRITSPEPRGGPTSRRPQPTFTVCSSASTDCRDHRPGSARLEPLRLHTPAEGRRGRGRSKRPRIHDLRHTHASGLIAGKVPLPVIQKRFGHELLTTTTVDRYAISWNRRTTRRWRPCSGPRTPQGRRRPLRI